MTDIQQPGISVNTGPTPATKAEAAKTGTQAAPQPPAPDFRERYKFEPVDKFIARIGLGETDEAEKANKKKQQEEWQKFFTRLQKIDKAPIMLPADAPKKLLVEIDKLVSSSRFTWGKAELQGIKPTRVYGLIHGQTDDVEIGRDFARLKKDHKLTAENAYEMALLIYLNPEAQSHGVTINGSEEEKKILLAALTKVNALYPEGMQIRVNNPGMSAESNASASVANGDIFDKMMNTPALVAAVQQELEEMHIPEDQRTPEHVRAYLKTNKEAAASYQKRFLTGEADATDQTVESKTSQQKKTHTNAHSPSHTPATHAASVDSDDLPSFNQPPASTASDELFDMPQMGPQEPTVTVADIAQPDVENTKEAKSPRVRTAPKPPEASDIESAAEYVKKNEGVTLNSLHAGLNKAKAAGQPAITKTAIREILKTLREEGVIESVPRNADKALPVLVTIRRSSKADATAATATDIVSNIEKLKKAFSYVVNNDNASVGGLQRSLGLTPKDARILVDNLVSKEMVISDDKGSLSPHANAVFGIDSRRAEPVARKQYTNGHAPGAHLS